MTSILPTGTAVEPMSLGEAKTRRGVLRQCHLDEWERTTALSSPSHQVAYK
jgi:hypothetical protein